MGAILRLLLIVLVIIAVFLLLIRFFQNRLVFFPDKSSQDFILPATTEPQRVDYYIPFDLGKMHAWHFFTNRDLPTILFLHGNAGNLADRFDFFQLLQDKLAVNLFAIDYRGYGKSDGRPTENGVYRDAQLAWEFLTDSLAVKPDKIIVWGRSLGGAIAVDLITKKPVNSLILEATFTSAKDMMKQMFSPIPVWYFSSIKFDSQAKINANPIPKLYLHGDADAVVPFALGRKLYEIDAGNKNFIRLPGANHNNTFIAGGEKYWQAINSFIIQNTLQSQHEQVDK